MKVKRERSWEKNPGRFSGAVLRDDMLTAYLFGRVVPPPQPPLRGDRAQIDSMPVRGGRAGATLTR
ncbi:hypothetical protein MTS1_00623 [Microbacterium sp. TS-1]|nr:hypothetical protein MTS1_00623 [Microbacterium sp. TS-1]